MSATRIEHKSINPISRLKKILKSSDERKDDSRCAMIAQILDKTPNEMKSIAALIKDAPALNKKFLYDFLASKLHTAGYLKDEKIIFYIISQFEDEDFTKNFLKHAKPFFTKAYDINYLLSRTEQINYLKNKAEIGFNKAYSFTSPAVIAAYLIPEEETIESAARSDVKREAILDELYNYRFSLDITQPIQQFKAYKFFERCEETYGLDQLMEIINEVTPDGQDKTVYPAVSKFQVK